MTGFELLRQYVDTRAQGAFAAVVRRHVDHVYAAALRQTARDGDAAEEVTQRVFILLADKAPQLVAGDPHLLLDGWLFNAVRFIARDVLRKEERRARHEQKAAEMADQIRGAARDAASGPANAEWKEVEAELDEAMAHLAEPTRGVLVLRFFEGKTAREVGEQLGISEEAARKRVSRAVDELRERFTRRGVVLSATALAEGLATVALLKAPAGLAASAAAAASATAVSAVTSAAASATGAASVTGGVIMASAKAKAAALIAAVVLLSGGAVAVAPKFFSPVRQRTVTLARPAAMLMGTIRGPDGRPVSGAQVRIGTATRRVSVYATRNQRIDATTDAAGAYAVARPDPPYVLVARAPQGYAEVSWSALGAAGEIVLQPWSRIEGVAKVGNEPLANVAVRLHRSMSGADPLQPLVYHSTETQSDAAGKFSFPQVAPGETWIYRSLHRRRGGGGSVGARYLQLAPGAIAQVALGGSGVAVVGRVHVPADIAHLIDWRDTENGRRWHQAHVRHEMPTERAKHGSDETPEQYRAAEEAFGRTPPGRTYKQWMFLHDFIVNPDGTFRIDDLAPGQYNLTIRNFELLEDVSMNEDLARGEASFEITRDAGPTLELPTITLKNWRRVVPGMVAPDFTAETVDGQTWRLADHRDKIVVLVFWGTWSNTHELANFGALAQKYGRDSRVAVFGCFNAKNLELAREYIKNEKLDFPHTADMKLMHLYDSSWPMAVLIGRDGRIIKKHLHGDALIDNAVEGRPTTAPVRPKRGSRRE